MISGAASALGTTFLIGRGSVRRGVADCRRQCDAGRSQGQAGGGAWRGSDNEALAVVLDLDLGQRIQIGDDFWPGAHAAEHSNVRLQRGLQHQCEEAAEYVTTDGLIELVDHRPGGRYMLCVSK